MSKKRTATTELNSDNWDQEDEPEEPGTFKAVGQEELSKRAIKVARRRLPKTNDEQRPLFSSFSGFGKTNNAVVPDVKSTFSFLSNMNGSHAQTSPTVPVSNENKSGTEKSSSEDRYLSNIKKLNECLIDWINKCVQKNPSCVLTPIFRDYEKHFESLKTSPEKNSEEPKSSEVTSFKLNFTPNTNNSQSGTSPLQKANNFNNTIAPSSTPAASSWLSSSAISKSNVFSNLSSNSADSKPMFSFLSKPPALNNDSAPEKNDETTKDEEDGEDAPPVNDFKPVTEDDALYSQRVKVFVKNDKQYADRGVGTLFIKEAKDGKGNKIHQVIVRADTSLGNIIFNIRITSDIPTKRLGKNNVMVVCLPTPDSKPPPVPVLLRVKTEDEANKLLAEIDKYK